MYFYYVILVVLRLFVKAASSHFPPGLHSKLDEETPIHILPRFESSEQRLMQDLISGYDSSVRPVYDALEAVDVQLGLTLTQILDIDEKNQVLTTNVWLEAEWFDERLNWSAADYGGVYAIRIPCEKLWLPDIVLYNSVDDYTSGYMPSLAMVYNTSRVFWGPVIRFRSSCKIDITFFPFDTQVCKLKLGSWAYTGLEVDVWNSSDTMDLSNFVDNGEWELLGVAVHRNVVYYNCCKEPFPDVTFTIQLRRRTKYYFMNIIIPCIILSFLCLGGFLLPPESGEKITLGLSVLLTITVFMLMVADKMPQTSESISVISIYLMVVLATSCLSVLSSVLVLSIHHQRGPPSRAPSWLRRFCFKVITPLLCLRTQHDATPVAEMVKTTNGRKIRPVVANEAGFRTRKQIYNSKDEHQCVKMDYSPSRGASGPCDVQSSTAKKDKRHNTYEHVYTPGQQPLGTYNASYTLMQQQQQQQQSYTWKESVHNHSPQQHRLILEDNLPKCEIDDVEEVHSVAGKLPDDSFVDDASSCGSRKGQTYNLIIGYLIKLIQTRQEDEIKDEEIFKEWHDVAYVLDRLLFYVFFAITLVSTVCILEMRPPVQTI